jgi:hypothetical protein
MGVPFLPEDVFQILSIFSGDPVAIPNYFEMMTESLDNELTRHIALIGSLYFFNCCGGNLGEPKNCDSSGYWRACELKFYQTLKILKVFWAQGS